MSRTVTPSRRSSRLEKLAPIVLHFGDTKPPPKRYIFAAILELRSAKHPPSLSPQPSPRTIVHSRRSHTCTHDLGGRHAGRWGENGPEALSMATHATRTGSILSCARPVTPLLPCRTQVFGGSHRLVSPTTSYIISEWKPVHLDQPARDGQLCPVRRHCPMQSSIARPARPPLSVGHTPS